MAEQDFVTVGIEGDADGLAREIEAALNRAFSNVARDFGQTLGQLFSKAGPGAKRFQDTVGDIGDNAQRAFKQAADGAKAFDRTMDGVNSTLRSSKSALSGDAFDATRRTFNDLSQLIDRLKRDIAGLGSGTGDREVARNLTASLRSAANQANVVQQSLAREASIAARGRVESERLAQQDVTRLAIAGSKERIVAAQQEGAQTLASIRASSAQRVAILRTLTTAIRGIEEGFSRVVSGGSSVLGRGISGISNVFTGITNAVRRSNSEMTQGLGASLDRRTSLISQSFSKQETIIRESVSRQARTVERFNTVTATGLTGLATGRSNAANALGIGGILGGGFLIFSKLKDGIKQAQDFNQTMAVLQQQLGLTGAQMNGVRKSSIQLGNDLSLPGVSAKDAGDAINILTRQFGSLGPAAVDAAQKAAKGTLQLARATGSSADDAAALIGASVNIFGIAADQAVGVADKITGALAKAAGVGFSDFKDAFVQGATVFQNFVGPAESANDVLLDFNTSLAVLAKSGIVGETAGAGLKQFFLAVQGKQSKDAIQKQKDLTKAAGETGTIFFDASGKARRFTDSIGILRTSLAGMNDEQRATTLTTLFGARAQTIASALVKGSAADWDALRASMEQEGLAAKVAAAQNQGLRGGLDALGSVIDTLILQGFNALDKPLGNAVVAFADFINKLASGTGVFEVARDALKGVALALGGLLAIKAVIEGVQLLALAFGAVLSPVGLLIVGVAAAGAAISILSKRSEGFRTFLEDLKQRAIDLGSAGIEFLKDKLSQLRDFMIEVAIPAVLTFAEIVKVNAVAAFEVASNFIRQTVIPALQTFASFVTGTVLPAIRDGLIRGFELAGTAISAFWDVVEPVLTPAIDGIMDLVGAIDELAQVNPGRALLSLGGIVAAAVGGFAVAGPVGATIAGLGATVAAIFANGLQSNLVSALAGIGGTIAAALKPAIQGLKNVFTLGNVIDFGLFATGIAQKLGAVLGKIVSDPRVVAGVAGFAGFAALAAGRFILGFGQGILSNVPALAAMFKSAFTAALSAAVNGLTSLSLGQLLTGFALLFTGAQALSLWRTAGTTMGNEVKTGLLSSFRNMAFGGVFSGGGAGGGFFTALFGGANGIDKAVQGELSKAETSVRLSVRKMNAILSAAGQGVSQGARPFASFRQDVESQFARLSDNIGPKGILGLKIRAGFTAALDSLRSVSLQPVKDFFQQMNITAGQAAAAVGKTFAAGLAGAIAGFQVGKSLVGQSGLSQLLGVGGLALSLGAVHPALGLAAGAAGLAGIAFGNMAKKAEDARIKIEGLAGALQDAGDDISDKTKAIATDLGRELAKDVNPKALQKALDAGLDLTGIVQQVTVQGKDINDVLNNVFNDKVFTDKLHRAGLSSVDFFDILHNVSDELHAIDGAQTKVANNKAIQTQLDKSGDSARTAADKVQQYQDKLQRLNEEPGTTLQGINDALSRIAGEFDKAKAAADRFFGTGTQTNLQAATDQFLLNIPNLKARIDQIEAPDLAPFLKQTLQNQLKNDIVLDVKGLANVALQTGAITSAQGGINFLEGLKAQIQGLMASQQIDAAVGLNLIAGIDSLEKDPGFQATISAFLAATPASATVPANITVVPLIDPGLPAAIQEAIRVSATRESQGKAGFGNSRPGIGGGGGQSISIPITISPNITVDTSSSSSAGVAVARAFIQGVTASFFAAQVAGAGLSLAATSTFASAAASAGAAGRVLSANFANGVRSGIGAAVSAARTLGALASSAVQTSTAAAFAAGRSLASGLAAGIQSGAGAAIAAARAMANAVAAIARSALQIHSPSQVFADIGRQIGLGLAQGIADSADDISGVLSNVLNKVTGQARTMAGVIAEATSGLFDQLAPSGGGLGNVSGPAALNARAALASIGGELADVFQNTAVTLWNAVVAFNEGSANGVQRAITDQFAAAGQNFGSGSQASLDPSTILGAGNIAGFLGAAGKIRDFISTAVSAGEPLGNVIAIAQQYRDQLGQVAFGYHANTDAVAGLLGQLGLLDPQLQDFINQANALQAAASVPATPTPSTTTAQNDAETKRLEAENAALKEQLRTLGLAGQRPVELNIYPPFGDPEAIGLGAANRVAVALNGSF